VEIGIILRKTNRGEGAPYQAIVKADSYFILGHN
jgi:hypothetical protein